MHQYSDYFKTLHDEVRPTGYLGRGTHYSVLRAVVFHDPIGRPLSQGQFTNFAVIWDEDHDVRVMEPIEEIYRRGLLSSVLMFGEHKGLFTAVLSNEVSSAVKTIPFNPAFLWKVSELELSIRSANCLNNDNVIFIGDLVQKTEDEMLRVPNFGRKSLNEIKATLIQMGLNLGIEIPGWPPENIEELFNNSFRIRFLKTETNTICQSLDDPWTSVVAALDSESYSIIHDEKEKVSLYLKNLQMLWQLGLVTEERETLAMPPQASVAA